VWSIYRGRIRVTRVGPGAALGPSDIRHMHRERERERERRSEEAEARALGKYFYTNFQQ